MVKIGPSLLHVGDWRQGSSGSQGRMTAHCADHTGFLRSSACCPLPWCLPSSWGRLLPPAPLRCYFTSAVEPSLPGSAAVKGGLLNSDKSPKWKAGWWFQYFSKRDFQVKDFCVAQKTVSLAFQIPLLISQFLQQLSITGRK